MGLNNYVCLADDILFPADRSRRHSSVRSLVAVIRLIGDSDSRRSSLINNTYFISTQNIREN
jgi:hypothetical protein